MFFSYKLLLLKHLFKARYQITMVKYISLLIVLLLLTTNCKHKTTRHYIANKKNTPKKYCKMAISEQPIENSDIIKNLGSITLKKRKLAITNTIYVAYKTLKKEGCRIGANLVLISFDFFDNSDEHFYNCKATFYIVDSSVADSLDESHIFIQPKNQGIKTVFYMTLSLLGSVLSIIGIH